MYEHSHLFTHISMSLHALATNKKKISHEFVCDDGIKASLRKKLYSKFSLFLLMFSLFYNLIIVKKKRKTFLYRINGC